MAGRLAGVTASLRGVTLTLHRPQCRSEPAGCVRSGGVAPERGRLRTCGGVVRQ